MTVRLRWASALSSPVRLTPPTDADRAKILLDLVAFQQAERAQLRQDTAKVSEALKKAQEANRPVKPTKG